MTTKCHNDQDCVKVEYFDLYTEDWMKWIVTYSYRVISNFELDEVYKELHTGTGLEIFSPKIRVDFEKTLFKFNFII